MPRSGGAWMWFRARPFLSRAHHARGGCSMFEHQQKDHIDAVMKANPEFRRLYQYHQELDSKVRDAELGVLPMHDNRLHGMKKEKLLLKDRLTRMWSEIGTA
jgi:uncharacterized protein YdcH (DUF465 family)